MVETSRVRKKVKKPAMTVYILVLFLITVVLGAIVYIVSKEIVFTSGARERYEVLIAERDSFLLQFETLNNQFTTSKGVLDKTQSLKERTKRIQEVLEKNDDVAKKIDQIIEVDREILKLNLDTETEAQFKELYQKDLVRSSLADQYFILLKFEEALNQYYLAEVESTSCFTKINYDNSSPKIAKNITSCLNLVESQILAYQEIPADLPDTNIYLQYFKSYWQRNKELYDSLESRDKEEVQELQKDISNLDKQKDDAFNESEKEIKTWFARENSEIDLLKSELE